MSQVKREQSALLWRLLPAKVRREIARYLRLQELQDLNTAFDSYKKKNQTDRRRIEEALRRDISRERRGLPALLSILLLVSGTVLWVIYPTRLPEHTRLVLFAPLLLGALSPLALYFLPPHRIRALFHLPDRPESFLVFVGATLALIWLVSLIGMEDFSGVIHQDRLTLFILVLGAGLAPLLEEVLFRELLPGLAGKSPHFIGHCASVLLFALAHFPSSGTMLAYYILSGGFLSLLRIQTGGLLLPLAAHSIANIAVVLVRFW
ncbi:MAG: CPBP family intramembrane metalloprotease [Leptospirales bacterium]|nr:CPBP family intramembrane metalloprotease [Leptospirales bacterium]